MALNNNFVAYLGSYPLSPDYVVVTGTDEQFLVLAIEIEIETFKIQVLISILYLYYDEKRDIW